ncbi:MAG: hypothetical protein WCL71_03715 [Deltaproteobacteria bacterium]
MTNPTPITIGIPYREEGQDFSLLAGGLLASLQDLPSNVTCEIIICVNGSSAGCEGHLSGLLAPTGLEKYQARVITSPKGKLAAQLAIVKERKLNGYLAFVDSDVVLGKPVLRLLWSTLETDKRCMVAYGQPVPVFPVKLGLLHRLLRVHYSLRERAYHRPYFHGRAFMLREWFFDPPGDLRGINPKVVERLRLAQGPIIDDIAMSRMALARWGGCVIREVQEANVYFDPIDTIRGMYAAAIRVALELERLDLLYPQHARLKKSYSTSCWNSGELRRYSLRMQLAHALFRGLDAGIKRFAKVHVALIKAGLLRTRTLWVRVPGTKQFARNRHDWDKFRRIPQA